VVSCRHSAERGQEAPGGLGIFILALITGPLILASVAGIPLACVVAVLASTVHAALAPAHVSIWLSDGR
jgi:hypothetical protein